MKKLVFSLLVATLLITTSAVSSEIPKIIFTDDGLYLSSDPSQQAKFGEQFSLMKLGRRFHSCRVFSEYYLGEDEGITTEIECEGSKVSFTLENGKFGGYWTNSKGASFLNNVQVGDPITKALGKRATCNLCTEDEAPYCEKFEGPTARYDITYDQQCSPISLRIDEGCRGKFKLSSCVSVSGLGTDPS